MSSVTALLHQECADVLHVTVVLQPPQPASLRQDLQNTPCFSGGPSALEEITSAQDRSTEGEF